jgi:hypothetical protein
MSSQSKSTPARTETFTAFLEELSSEETRLKIHREATPPEGRSRRLDSDTLWDALEKHFPLDGSDRAKLKRQGCRTDLSCLRKVVIENLDVLDEEMLKNVQLIAAAAHLPPYNSLKDWFTPVIKAAKSHYRRGDKHPHTQLIAKYMRSPERNHLIQRRDADQGVVQRNRKGLNVNYPQALRTVEGWISSDDWRELFLAVMASCGPRKTAILDRRIIFVEAEQHGHDKRFWVQQVGVLKDPEQTFDEEDDAVAVLVSGKTVEKPLAFGLTFAQIDRAIKKVRAAVDTEGLNRKQMGAKYGPELVAMVKEAFPGPAAQNPRLGTHFLRALYGNVAYRFFKDAIGNSLTAFLSDVLAHNPGSLNTAISYQTINIQWGMVEDVDADTKMVATENREAIASLREQVGPRMPPTVVMASSSRTVWAIAPSAAVQAAAVGEPEHAASGSLAAKGGPSLLQRKRKRGVPVGTSILLRLDDETWRPFKKPTIMRGEERRRPQMLKVVRELLAANVPASKSNLGRLGFGRGPAMRANLAWAAEQLNEDEAATEGENAWAAANRAVVMEV